MALEYQPKGPSFTTVVLMVLMLCAAILIEGCAAKVDRVPPQAAPAVKVLVPIAAPCVVEKVEKSPLPSESLLPDDLYDAVKTILADRAILLGDREKFAAANSDPCPVAK